MEEAAHAFRLRSKLPINNPTLLHSLLFAPSPHSLSHSLCSQTKSFSVLSAKYGGVGSLVKATWYAG